MKDQTIARPSGRGTRTLRGGAIIMMLLRLLDSHHTIVTLSAPYVGHTAESCRQE